MADLTNRQISKRYKITGVFAEGGISVVYKGIDLETRRVIAVKCLKGGAGSRRAEDLIRFRNEANIISKLSHPNILKIHEIGQYEGFDYIVMDFTAGVGLDKYISENSRIDIPAATLIIEQIVHALICVHDKGVIHRDLKPANIIVVPELLPESGSPDSPAPAKCASCSGRYTIKLLDFGLSQIMDFNHAKETGDVVGTFGYMSPEQTGIIHKPVDERSDLYSLGVIAYELLTHQIPFSGRSVGEILHQQVAKEPGFLHLINKDVPQVLEEIILKLLKKDPEQRYQTAKGLQNDIDRYHRGRAFVLGKDDRSGRVNYRTRLVGREEDLDILRRAYERAASGRGAVCLVGGEAGKGKSRLVEEMRSYIYQRGGEFIGGLCFSQENKIPYQPFSESINEYISGLDKFSPEEKGKAISRMRESVGELGEVICRLNSSMRQILGEVPSLASLDPDREKKRFLMVASKFFCALGEPGKPVAVVLDDLQWADEGTLHLLREILKNISKSRLLIMGTYRDNELSGAHGLFKLLHGSDIDGSGLTNIILKDLSVNKINSIICELLLADEHETYKLACYVYDKGKGNPFFTLAIVRQLVDEKVLLYKHNKWCVEYDKLGQVSVSSSIVEILLKRIERLTFEQEKFLAKAAVIGKKFSVDVLRNLSGFSWEETVGLVDGCIDLQLLERGPQRGDLLFVHDRVRDAFYQRAGDEEKKGYHLKIAQIIEDIHNQDINKVVFELAYHYSESGDKSKALQYALPAAQRAMAGYANQEAVKYYKIAIDILEERGMTRDEKWQEAKEGLATVYLATGNYQQAIDITRNLIPLKNDRRRLAGAYQRIGDAHFRLGNWQECEDNLVRALSILGERVSRGKFGFILALPGVISAHFLILLFPCLFSHRRGKPVSPVDRQIIAAYFRLIWLYILTDAVKCSVVVLRTLNIARLRIGESKELSMALSFYGALCASLPLFKSAERNILKALAIADKFQFEWCQCIALQYLAYNYQWGSCLEKSVEFFERSREIFLKIGDLWDLGMSYHGLAHYYRYTSDYKKSIEYDGYHLNNALQSSDSYGVGESKACMAYSYAELGDFTKAERFAKDAIDVSRENNILFALCFCLEHYGYILLEKGDYAGAVDYLEPARKMSEHNLFIKEYAVYVYPYLAEAYIEQLKQAKDALAENNYRRKLRKIKRLAALGLFWCKIWKNHYGPALKSMAKYYVLVNKHKKAAELFLKSIMHNKRLNRKYELAKSLYEYGNLFAAQDKQRQAREKWQAARDIFKTIGAKAYLERVEAVLDPGGETRSAQERLTERRQLASVISASQSLSSILELDVLLEKIMDICIEVSGAERGFLFLYPSRGGGELKLTVSRNVEKDSFRQERLTISRTLIEQVEKSLQTCIVVDAGEDDGFKDRHSVVRYGLRSILCIPLIVREKMIGLVYVDNRLVGGLFTEAKAELLKTIAVQAAISIENARLYREVQDKARMQEELRLGRQIQMSLLPQKTPNVDGLRLCGLMEPASEIGGDYYDFIITDKLGIVIGDVAGKGVAAGMLMATAKTTLYNFRNQHLTPRQKLLRVHDMLFEYEGEDIRVMTMLYLEWDWVKKEMIYASGGHEHILVCRNGSNPGAEVLLDVVQSGGVMLGAAADISIVEREVEDTPLVLAPGDKVILYTDGVTEALNKNREPYTLQRLNESICRHGKKSIRDLITSVKSDIYAFIGQAQQYDDITLVGIEVE